MTTFTINEYRWASLISHLNSYPLLPILAILLIYHSFPLWIYHIDPTAALPDIGVWALILLAILVFLILLWLISYLFKTGLGWFNLPTFQMMISQFKQLTLWQQYVLYWASFALLLLAAIGCLIAIC